MTRTVARGFTLIEILIVIAFFAAGAVVLLQVFSMGLYGSVDNENTMIATALAQEKMEEIRNVAYASVVPEARAQVTNYASFDREVLVVNAPASNPNTNLKQVTVNIYWNGKTGDVKISLVTYVSNII